MATYLCKCAYPEVEVSIKQSCDDLSVLLSYLLVLVVYIISGETSTFVPQRLPFYKALGVTAGTVGKVRASTVFMCVCSTFRSSDFLLFVKNGFVVGVRTLNVTAGH